MILTFAARSKAYDETALKYISVHFLCCIMLGTKCRFAPSSDCIAQTLDPSSVVVFCSASHVTYNIVFAAMVLHFSALHYRLLSSNTGPAGI